MFVELIESLRCPRSHAESQLVLAAGKTRDRFVIDGVLGCPTCGAEFRIENGISHFEAPKRPTPAQPTSAEAGLRLAAFLGLTDAKGFAILCGSWGSHVDAIQRVAETPLLLLNPPARVDGEPAGVILCDAAPLAHGSARAAALDPNQSIDQIASVVRAVRDGGRVVAPVALMMPLGLTELTRDDELWVAEKQSTRLVQLTR